MLRSKMEKGVRNFSRQYESIVRQAFALSQCLKLLWAKHLAERVRCIHGPIDEDVGNVDTLWSKLGVERLA